MKSFTHLSPFRCGDLFLPQAEPISTSILVLQREFEYDKSFGTFSGTTPSTGSKYFKSFPSSRTLEADGYSLPHMDRKLTPRPKSPTHLFLSSLSVSPCLQMWPKECPATPCTVPISSVSGYRSFLYSFPHPGNRSPMLHRGTISAWTRTTRGCHSHALFERGGRGRR